MTNSADADQLASKPTYLDLYCLQRQGISGFNRTRVKHRRRDSDILNLCVCVFFVVVVLFHYFFREYKALLCI